MSTQNINYSYMFFGLTLLSVLQYRPYKIKFLSHHLNSGRDLYSVKYVTCFPEQEKTWSGTLMLSWINAYKEICVDYATVLLW